MPLAESRNQNRDLGGRVLMFAEALTWPDAVVIMTGSVVGLITLWILTRKDT